MKRLSEIIHESNVKTAILAVPDQSAQDVCNELVRSGITGILNFTPHVLKAPEDVIIDNIHLTDNLESLIYSVKELSNCIINKTRTTKNITSE